MLSAEYENITSGTSFEIMLFDDALPESGSAVSFEVIHEMPCIEKQGELKLSLTLWT